VRLSTAPTKGHCRTANDSAKVQVGMSWSNSPPRVLTHRASLQVSFAPGRRHEGLQELLRVGHLRGRDARPKVHRRVEPKHERSALGAVKAPAGFDYWLLKFDGVSANKDKGTEDPQRVLRSSSMRTRLMSADAGIEMSDGRH